MAKIWARIRETIEGQGAAALISVISSAGSVPREAGARIVLQPDGGFFGTIGGGRLEFEAIADARLALSRGRGGAQSREWPLGPNLGQCCGGVVRTLAETFDSRDLATVRRLEAFERDGAFVTESHIDDEGRIARTPAPRSADDVPLLRPGRARTRPSGGRKSFTEHFGEVTAPVLLFGAGHVGRAVVLALAPLPFSVRWIDGRADQFPRHLPPNTVTVCTDDPGREIDTAPRDALIVIMTHSHPLDFDIAVHALQGGTFDFVGLIGSETKRARFASYARQVGLGESAIERLVCPIGIVAIKGKEPAVIAASLAAQLLLVSERASAVEPSPAMQPA